MCLVSLKKICIKSFFNFIEATNVFFVVLFTIEMLLKMYSLGLSVCKCIFVTTQHPIRTMLIFILHSSDTSSPCSTVSTFSQQLAV